MVKIFLSGFMGSGKSFLRERLARELPKGWRSFDFDDEVLSFSNLKTSYSRLDELIEKEGWEFFRKLERELLVSTLKNSTSGLFALGGGGLENGGAELILKNEQSRLVNIQAELNVCWQRVKNDFSRPLVRLGKEAFSDLYQSRLAEYEKADIIIDETRINKVSLIDLLGEK